MWPESWRKRRVPLVEFGSQPAHAGFEDDLNLILAPREICYTLRQLQASGTVCKLLFGGSVQCHATRVVQTLPEQAQLLILDPYWTAAETRPEQRAFTLSASHGSTAIAISSEIIEHTSWQDLPCLLAVFPNAILKTEMRAFFRHCTSERATVSLLIHTSKGDALAGWAMNLSENGFQARLSGANARALPVGADCEVSMRLSNSEQLHFSGRIRHQHEGQGGLTIGCEILGAASQARHAMRRYVLQKAEVILP